MASHPNRMNKNIHIFNKNKKQKFILKYFSVTAKETTD